MYQELAGPHKEELLRAYEERSSLRGLERTFGVSRNTVIAWKKAAKLPALSETVVAPEAKYHRHLLHCKVVSYRRHAIRRRLFPVKRDVA